jgi:hypothetical protein
MPMELQIIRAHEFIRLGAHGQLDIKSSCEVLAVLADACRKRSIDRALLDVRDIHTNLTPTDLAKLVQAFREVGFTENQRLALLHRGDQNYRARMFAFIGALRGWTLRAFDSYEDAIGWLSAGDSTPQADSPSMPKEIPVQFDGTTKPPPGTGAPL